MYVGEIWFLLDRDTTKPALYNPGDRGMKSLVCEGLDISGVNKRNKGEKWGEGDGGAANLPRDQRKRKEGRQCMWVNKNTYMCIYTHGRASTGKENPRTGFLGRIPGSIYTRTQGTGWFTSVLKLPGWTLSSSYHVGYLRVLIRRPVIDGKVPTSALG